MMIEEAPAKDFPYDMELFSFSFVHLFLVIFYFLSIESLMGQRPKLLWVISEQ